MKKFIVLFLFCEVLLSSFAQKVELVLPIGHTGNVNKALLTADGKWVLTASADNSISIWDAGSGNEIKKLKGHTDAVNDVAVSANSKYIVSGSEDGKAIFWNAQTGKILNILAHEFEPVKRVAISVSPKANFLVTCSYSTSKNQSTAYFWRLPGAQLAKKFDLIGEEIQQIVISEQSLFTYLLSVSGTLYQVDGSTLDLSTLSFESKVDFMELSPDGKLLAQVSKDYISVIDSKTREKVIQFDIEKSSGIKCLTFSSRSNYLYALNRSKQIVRYPLTAGEPEKLITTLESDYDMLAASADGKNLLAYGNAPSVYLLDESTGNLTHCLMGKSIPVSDFSLIKSDGRIISLYADSSIKQWRIADRISLEKILQLKNKAQFFDVDSVGETFLLAGNNFQKVISENESSPILLPSGKGSISADGKTIAIIDDKGHLQYSINGNKLEDFDKDAIISLRRGIPLIDSAGNIFTATQSAVTMYAPPRLIRVNNFSIGTDQVGEFAISENGKLLAIATSKDVVKVFETSAGKIVAEADPTNLINFQSNPVLHLAISHNNLWLAYSCADRIIRMFNIKTGKESHIYYGHTEDISELRFSANDSFLVSSAADNTIRIWPVNLDEAMAKSLSYVTAADFSFANIVLTKYDPNSVTMNSPAMPEKASLMAFKNDDWIVFTPERYYFCNKGAARELGFNKNGKYYGFEQFDLKYNRPDKVLQSLGVNDTTLIAAYHKAYQKRLSKLGFTESQLNEDFNLPEIKILNADSIKNPGDMPFIEFDLNMKDEKSELRRLYCQVNGVGLFGKNGLDISAEKSRNITKRVKVPLSVGKNVVQFYALNNNGAESYKTQFTAEYKPKTKVKSTLHLLAISVSEYKQSEMNLKYAVKDGRDMVNKLKMKRGFDQILIDTFFNQRVNKEIMQMLRKKLVNTGPDDEVILFVSGHGLLDDNLDFYFATYDMDFNNPSVKGISFEALEDLLDSIPARKKLLLMDACHSGEVDKEAPVKPATSNQKKSNEEMDGQVKLYSARGSELLESESKLGLQNTFEMMQELFAGINKGSGTIVISAAAGKGVAYESPTWNNGVFSYSILSSIESGRADINKDGNVSTRELMNFVSAEVERLTNGAQKPTSRRENLSFDWNVWKY